MSLPDVLNKCGLQFLGPTSEELEKKLSDLRTYYGEEIGKERSSRTSAKGTKEVYLSKWPFFASLHFLRDNITPSNLDTDMSEEKENEAVDHNLPSQQATQQVPNDGSVFPTDNPPSVKKQQQRKKTLASEDELLSTCLQEMKLPKENVIDADAGFGQYVSKQLKKIPEGHVKEMYKIEIQQSILKVMLPVAQPCSNLVTVVVDDLNDI